MATKAMKFRHRQFLKLYLGNTPIAGNATQCYKAVYGDHITERSAQVSGARLLQLPHIEQAIIQAEQIALDQLAVDAQFVLKENLRLYQRAMGDESFDHVEVDTDPDTGQERVSVTSQRSYDPATAHKALTSIGQHRDVQAFSQVIEHTHTHVLEQRLAARSKLIEGRAQVLDAQQLVEADLVDHAPADVDQVEQAPARIDDSTGVQGEAPGVGIEHAPAHTAAKRVHPGGGQDERARAQEKTIAEREGATVS